MKRAIKQFEQMEYDICGSKLRLRLLLVFLPILSMGIGASAQQHDGRLEANWVEAKAGTQAPELNFVYEDGSEGALADFAGERVVVVNFWATWCRPCRAEMPTLQALAVREFDHDQQPIVLAIALEQDFKKASRFLLDLGARDVVLALDSKGVGFRSLSKQGLGLDKLKGLPITLVIAKNGTMLGHIIGPANWNDSFAQMIVERALK